MTHFLKWFFRTTWPVIFGCLILWLVFLHRRELAVSSLFAGAFYALVLLRVWDFNLNRPTRSERIKALRELHEHSKEECWVYFEQDGKPIEIVVDLGEAYGDSELAERVADALDALEREGK